MVGDDFLGSIGGCGLPNNPGQIDTYLIHRTTGMDEDNVQNLAQNIEIIPPDRLADVTDFVEKKVAESIQQYANPPEYLIPSTNRKAVSA